MSSLSLNLKSQTAKLIDAGACAGAHIGIEKFYYNQELDVPCLKKGAVCGVSHYAAEASQGFVNDFLLKNATSNDMVKKSLVPVLCGGIYCGTDKFLQYDAGKSLMYKFFHAAGASAIGMYAGEPIGKALKLI